MTHKGFKVSDISDCGINLMYLPLAESAQPPKFKPCAKHPKVQENGFVLYYTDQCPYTYYWVPKVQEAAKEHGIPVVEDLGSGVLIDLEKYGLTHEPTVQESIAHGADVVCFSGDKLLGGPQAGIIIGKKKYIDMMKKNQLTRALRIDKFTAAALEMVLMEYLSEETAVQNIPVLRMIAMPLDEIEKEAGYFARILRRTGMDAKIQVVSCESQIGGGSLPLERMESRAVSIQPNGMSVAEMEEKMRHLEIPIIPRTVNDSICLDVRTIERKDYKMIASELTELLDRKKRRTVGVKEGYEEYYYRNGRTH